MGELVAGTPALQLNVIVSLPLDVTSFLSLLYRAVPGSGLDPWLIAARRALPDDLRADLDLLHGFSGRLLYYMEEPVMRFGPLRSEHLDARLEDLVSFLRGLPPDEYRAMAAHALERVHRDLGTGLAVPDADDRAGWRRYLAPALTTAELDDAVALLEEPSLLKQRTIGLMEGVWERVERDDRAARLPMLREAEALARQAAPRGFGLAFSDLTGNRLPAPLVAGLPDVQCVTFCPSSHLGTFVSYILYPPDLVIFFGAPELIARSRSVPANGRGAAVPSAGARPLDDRTVLEALQALADANRLRILDLLRERELYAQEIVGRLGIAQSAVSRHLALLERAGLVSVRPGGGMKHYAVERDRVEAIAEAVRARGAPAPGPQPG